MSALRRLSATGIPVFLARLILGGLMIRMGLAKIDQPVEFLRLLDQYDMFPAGWYVVQNLVAVGLPWIEVIAGVTLVLGLFRRGSALLFVALLTVFTIVIIQRGMQIHAIEGLDYSQIKFDCGCGGGPVYFVRKVPENMALWLLAWYCLLSGARRFSLDRLCFGRNPAHQRGSLEFAHPPAVDAE